MQKIEGRELKIKFTHEMLEELDRLSKRVGLRRNELIRNYIELGIDITHGYEKLGIVRLLEIKRRTKKSVSQDVVAPLFKA